MTTTDAPLTTDEARFINALNTARLGIATRRIERRAHAEAQAAGDAAHAAAPEGQKTDAYHRAYVLAARKAGLAPICHCDFCAATKAAVTVS